MEGPIKLSDAGLYTDFGGLQNLKTKASAQQGSEASKEATREVAKQFESLFLQMMLKEMRNAIPKDESSGSDQTRFYQEMFDKQIAIDLANGSNGGGLGIAGMLERDMKAQQPQNNDQNTVAADYSLITRQVNRSTSMYEQKTTDVDKE